MLNETERQNVLNAQTIHVMDANGLSLIWGQELLRGFEVGKDNQGPPTLIIDRSQVDEVIELKKSQNQK